MTVNRGTELTIVGIDADIRDMEAYLKSAGLPYRQGETPRDAALLPFAVEPLTAVIAALGSSGAIAAAVKCLHVYLKERKKRVHLVREGERLELSAENYDERELTRVLSELRSTTRIVIARSSERL